MGFRAARIRLPPTLPGPTRPTRPTRNRSSPSPLAAADSYALPQMLGPYRIPTRRHDSVRINGVFERFVKTLQGMVIERIHIHHGFLEQIGRAILAPAVLAAHCDQFFESLAVALVG